MKFNKAHGPDNISIELFSHCWDIVMPNIMHMFGKLYAGQLDVQRLNYNVITLFPNLNEVNTIQQF